MDSGGLIVAVQPDTQIVEWIVAWVTAGFSAPGVSAGSGSPGRRAAVVCDGGTMPVAPATNEGPALPAASSSASTLDALGDADAGRGVATPLADGRATAGAAGARVALGGATVAMATTGVEVPTAVIFCDEPDTEAIAMKYKTTSAIDIAPRNRRSARSRATFPKAQ
jgi:hypothetical protein